MMMSNLDKELILGYQMDVEVYLQEQGIEILYVNNYYSGGSYMHIHVFGGYMFSINVYKNDIIDILDENWGLYKCVTDSIVHYVMVGRLSELLIELRKL